MHLFSLLFIIIFVPSWWDMLFVPLLLDHAVACGPLQGKGRLGVLKLTVKFSDC